MKVKKLRNVVQKIVDCMLVLVLVNSSIPLLVRFVQEINMNANKYISNRLHTRKQRIALPNPNKASTIYHVNCISIIYIYQ